MGVFTETVVPVFGNLLATAMLLSPFPAVLRLRKSGKLGDINPLPYPMTCINAAGWVAYGYAVANPYIFPANVIGFIAGMFFTLTAFSCSPKKVQDRITAMFVVASAYFIMLGLIACFALDQEGKDKLWGNSGVIILILYYFVPLSTAVVILRTRNAASIYPPLAATAIANGALWTIYGFAIADVHLWLPNLFGAIIGVIQLVLRMVYGARPGSNGKEVIATETSADIEAAFAQAQQSSAIQPPLVVDGRQDSQRHLLATPGDGSSAAVAIDSSASAVPPAPPQDTAPVAATASEARSL